MRRGGGVPLGCCAKAWVKICAWSSGVSFAMGNVAERRGVYGMSDEAVS